MFVVTNIPFVAGEDRWLCTLLLQQGYKIDYAAASDAFTFAPEAFSEFFNQRRRWITSTLANQLDLLNDYRNTIRTNDNISLLFMVYQLILTISTILGPATIVLVFVTSFENILNLTLWEAYLLAVIPPALYILVCHICKPKTQIAVAGALSVAYAGVMLVVLVNLVVNFVSDKLQDVSLIFVTAVTACFILAGILHPYEFSSLLPGFIYYLCIPAGYLVLIIYAYANMHVVSWGTREGPKTKEEQEALEREKARKSKTWWSTLTGNWFAKDIKEFLSQLANSKANNTETLRLELYTIKKELKKLRKQMLGDRDDLDQSDSLEAVKTDARDGDNKKRNSEQSNAKSNASVIPQEDPMFPMWMQEDCVGDGELTYLDYEENSFWEKFIKKYEKPDRPLRKQDEIEKQDELKAALAALRNNSNFCVWFVNGLWILLNYLFQSSDVAEINLPPLQPIEPLGLAFLIPFVLVMAVQLLSMFIHRMGVFLQLLSITEIPNPLLRRRTQSNSKSSKLSLALRVVRDLQLGGGRPRPSEPPVDYHDNALSHPGLGPSTSHDPGELYQILQHSRWQIEKHREREHPNMTISRAVWNQMRRGQQTPSRSHHNARRSYDKLPGHGRKSPSVASFDRRHAHDGKHSSRDRTNQGSWGPNQQNRDQYSELTRNGDNNLRGFSAWDENYGGTRPNAQHYNRSPRHHRRHRREDRYSEENRSHRGHYEPPRQHRRSRESYDSQHNVTRRLQESYDLEQNFNRRLHRLSTWVEERV